MNTSPSIRNCLNPSGEGLYSGRASAYFFIRERLKEGKKAPVPDVKVTISSTCRKRLHLLSTPLRVDNLKERNHPSTQETVEGEGEGR